jgi:hypothetical protein
MPRWLTWALQAFAAGGLFFTVVSAWAFIGTVQSYRWKETPCTIVESRRQPNSNDFVVRYRYVVNGLERTSSRFTKGFSESPDRAATERLLLEYPKDHPAICYVNPANPDEAILKRGSLWSVTSILFSLSLLAVAVCGLIYDRSAREPWAAAIVERAARPAWLLFSTALVLVGLGLLWGCSIYPALRLLAARSWQVVPCQVVSSEVVEHAEPGDEPTYRVDIIYKYQVNGRPYISDRYDFFPGSSSGKDAKREVVKRYPARAAATCFVNPTDPGDAVFHREFSWRILWGSRVCLFSSSALGFGDQLRARRCQPRPKIRCLPARILPV